MIGGRKMQRVLSEDAAHGLADRALAGATLAEERDRDARLLVGMLHAPRQPAHVVFGHALVAGGEHFGDVSLHEAPVALFGLDTKSAPEVNLVINDRRAARLEDHATILPPPRVREPPCSPIHRAVIADSDSLVDVPVFEIA